VGVVPHLPSYNRRIMDTLLQVEIIVPQARLPRRVYPKDAGLDLYSIKDERIRPGEGAQVHTGIKIALPPKHIGMIVDRSSMGAIGLKVMGGIIDENYRGELIVILWNLSCAPININSEERIAQLIVYPVSYPRVYETKIVGNTDRGASGIGSTGK
jgi:dUTP pyrophosphatase